MMTTISAKLENEFLGTWQPEALATGSDNTHNAPDRATVSHRPGYAAFKLALVFALVLAVFALLPWSKAEAGSGISMQAAGYVYLSVPLNATEPQFEKSTLNLDFKGAGMYVLRLQMAQKTGKTTIRTDAHQRRDWRARRDALHTTSPESSFKLAAPKPNPVKLQRRASRRTTAKSQYMALLRTYERESSSSTKRSMYPTLIAAYKRARANR